MTTAKTTDKVDKTTTKTPMAIMARTTTTSFFDTTTILWSDVGCIPGKEGQVVISTTMTTMMTDDNNNDGDNDDLVGAFLANRSGGRQLVDQST